MNREQRRTDSTDRNDPAERPAPTDRELAARTLEGDEFAFRTLYRRHTPRLWPLLLRMLGGEAARAEAEDAVQETWIRAVRSLDGFRWDAAFSTWLTGIGLNCARELIRKRKRRSETSTDGLLELLPGGPAPDPGRRLDLEDAIAALPDGYRTVLVLHDLEGYTHPEISDRLGIAVGTSRSQLHHARRAVRELLEPTGQESSHGT
ncbi:MAG: RNA polymerase sigma factor [Longimicrobiales bacterium]|nr:RNA polymerase sigma factor [Longimicrobiales bacterium]